jgi:hypothetical protein
MSRNVTAPSVKPQVERLEGRDLPSFLLQGGTNTLLQPLKNMVTDMQTTQADLNTQFNFLVSRSTNTTPPPTNNNAQLGQIGVAWGKATADWQRMLNDRASVVALTTADLAFINGAVLAEAFEGDALDFFLWNFPFFGDFKAPFNGTNSPMAQSNAIITGTTVLNQVQTNFTFFLALGQGVETFGQIRGGTALPMF